MKPKIPRIASIIACCVLVVGIAHGQSNDPVVLGIPVPQGDSSTWTPAQVFYAGMSAGTLVQLFGWLVRIIRQTADHGTTL